MLKLVIGLGNPGRQYDNTPHNVGFHAVDVLAQRHGGAWAEERRFEAMTAERPYRPAMTPGDAWAQLHREITEPLASVVLKVMERTLGS